MRKTLKRNRARKGRHQLQAPEVQYRQAVWVFQSHVQPESEDGVSATAMEDVQHRSSAKTPHPKELNSYRLVALTSHLIKMLERLILVHLHPLIIYGPTGVCLPAIGVDDAVTYLINTFLTHLGKAGSTMMIMFFF